MPSRLRRYDEAGHIHFLTISCYRRLQFFRQPPITRGLVERAEQWVWSSYRYYEYDDDSVIAMDWDGSWPIV